MIAFALAKSGKLTLEKPDLAFPALVQALLPPGLRGLVVGGLLAALMSSLSSLFNSCSTLFTVDIYGKIRPGASDRELVRVGRIATAVVVVLGIVWIPVMKLDGLTYATTAAAAREETRRSWNAWDVVHTAIILAIIVAIYIYFRG